MCRRSSSGTSRPRFSTNSFELMMRPSRTMNTCTPATVSSRNRPTTSAFRLRADTACCLSARPLMVSMRAFTRPARSKSSSAAASCISAESSSTNSRCWPERNRSMRSHVLRVLLPRDAPAARAGAEAHVRVEARARLAAEQRERVFLQTAVERAPVGARRGAQRHHAPRDVHHLARGAAVGVGAEVARVGAVLLARVLDGRERVAFRERDERVGLVVLEVGVEKRRCAG